MDEALPVQGTRGFHCYIPLKSFQVSASPLSGLDSEFSAFDVLPNKNEFQDECDRVGSDRPSLFNSKAITPESDSEDSDDANPPKKKPKKDFFKS
ncbi:hypothetical protein OUZ56_032708 [Daphnia magna]|uniref:Uncharacterized protein n=1 Tax=Daphnia magna TaxID=35525 RepID=A0ABQ9ZX64_9CRUS|nr:hypothetical protein OUZ56_032708 [Daphnia magna]